MNRMQHDTYYRYVVTRCMYNTVSSERNYAVT